MSFYLYLTVYINGIKQKQRFLKKPRIINFKVIIVCYKCYCYKYRKAARFENFIPSFCSHRNNYLGSQNNSHCVFEITNFQKKNFFFSFRIIAEIFWTCISFATLTYLLFSKKNGRFYYPKIIDYDNLNYNMSSFDLY